jgi:UDP-arabinose 4-epimerase
MSHTERRFPANTRKILVTGGAGYIGSHTCKALYHQGYEPVVLDNLIYGHERFVKWGEFYKGDIGDNALLDEIFEKHLPAAVLHFAAFAYVGESVTDPGKYYTNNVSGTISLLEAMRRQKCRHMVFSSTCATYGIPSSLPIVETMVQQPINPYGRSKLMIEQILSDYDSAYGIKSCSLRYFNAAGADPDCEVGEKHLPETHLIPLVIETALRKRQCIDVYGTDYATADGTAIRDYIHVKDLADAHVKALQFLHETNCSEQFNLGTGKGSSVKRVIDTAERISQRDIPVNFEKRRLGDPPELTADAAKARSVLGWRPKYSDLETIIETAWKWHAHND